MGQTQTLTIHGWLPTRLNQLIGHRRKAGALKKRDRIVISNAARFQGIEMASGPRKVGIELTFGKGDRSGDPDAYYKSLLDGLVHAGLLTGDTYRRVQFTQPVFKRASKRKTVITLEDVEVEGPRRQPKERNR